MQGFFGRETSGFGQGIANIMNVLQQNPQLLGLLGGQQRPDLLNRNPQIGQLPVQPFFGGIGRRF
jgi:hypothetical protein